MPTLEFIKMHGLGNDFVILDGRKSLPALSAEQIRRISDRHLGVGCDQLVVLEPSSKADVFMRIYNADGSESGVCGNATRCVAWLMMKETGQPAATLDTGGGVLKAKLAGTETVAVDMGEPRLDWQEIPLAEEADTLHIPLTHGLLSDPVGVSMGNPHAVFFVNDLAAIPLEQWGPELENHALFPQRANIEVAQVTSDSSIQLRVWERGTGLTLACGSGACATLVAASRRGLTGRKAEVALPGGSLFIDWQEDNHVWMTGPIATSFHGTLECPQKSSTSAAA